MRLYASLPVWASGVEVHTTVIQEPAVAVWHILAASIAPMACQESLVQKLAPCMAAAYAQRMFAGPTTTPLLLGRSISPVQLHLER